MSEEKSTASGFLNFFSHLGQAKRTYRSGWMLRGVEEPESIADHMYRMSMMAFLAPSHLNRSKCIEMCLVHDLAESIVGDLTPQDKETKEEKAKLEDSAMAKLCDMLDQNLEAKEHLTKLYAEYSEHRSPEANYVKSLDLFDMFLQAYEYELLQRKELAEFFNSVPKCLAAESSVEPQVKEWIKELMALREKKANILPHDSNLNTILKDIILNKKDK